MAETEPRDHERRAAAEIVDRWATWMEAEGYVVPSAWRDHMREGLAAIIAEERERAEVEAVEIRRCFE